MTPETLKQAEELNDTWANSPCFNPTEREEILSKVMELLPDLIAAVKETGEWRRLFFGEDPKRAAERLANEQVQVQTNLEIVRKALQDNRELRAERDAAQRDVDELRDRLAKCIGIVQRWQPAGSPPPTDEVGTVAWIVQSLADERDALIASQQICVGAAGIGDFDELCGWIDKVRAERDTAQKAGAEMRAILDVILHYRAVDWEKHGVTSMRIAKILGTDCGRGYVKAESLTCCKCGDGNTALYCLNCARE